MAERVKGKEDKIRGEGGGCEKNLRGGMPERVKKTKCGGDVNAKQIQGEGVCRRG